jgi:hypothetical protein
MGIIIASGRNHHPMLKPVSAWFLFILGCCACGNPGQKKESGVKLQKIVIHPDQVFDLSGYAGSGGGNPWFLFDENAFVDPRYEKTGDLFRPVTNCQPTIHPAIYFHGTEGNRIVTDLKMNYQLKEIWFYDRSRTTDSCWIYIGNMKEWKKVAALVTADDSRNWGWKKISIDEETRYVMIRFSSYETNISEMVFYGMPRDHLQPEEHSFPPKGFTRIPLNQFLGVNYIMEREPRWLIPFHFSRIYNFALDYDNDTTRDEKKVRFNMLHYGYFDKNKADYVFDIDTLQHVNQGNIWFSIRGVSRWMSDLGFSDKDRPLNRPSLNSEDPASYSRHAEMMWHMAAFFGYNQVDTALLSLSHEPRRSGRGSMQIYENGNEEDAPWVGNKYCSPYEYYAQSSADWDGDEGRLGTRHGIHAADPRSKLMMSGLVGLDTNRVKVYRFLAENLRNDRQFIWQGGIQYHYYAQKNGKGISPEADSMRWKLARVADFSYRIAPGVKCFLGENGYDKSPASRQFTPLVPGYSASQSQAIMLLRSINAVFFSGFDAYILYWLRDGNPETDPRVYLTSGILRDLPDGKTLVYPGWYYISTLVNRLGKYIPDQIISEKGDAWIYRYRHLEHPDSLAYFVFKPTIKGSSLATIALAGGNTVGNQALKVSFLDDSDQGKEEILPVVAGKIQSAVSQKPILIFCKADQHGK